MTQAESLYGDVGEDEPCTTFRDCQEGLTCNREGALQLCRDPFAEHSVCFSDVVLGGTDTKGCFCTVHSGVSPQLEYGCSGGFEQSGDALCCADTTWPSAGNCRCWSQIWACGGNDTDCFCQWDRVSEGNAAVDSYAPSSCRNNNGRVCCASDFNCECADWIDQCQPNETAVTTCAQATEGLLPRCLDDETVVTECKAGPRPPNSLPQPDPTPPASGSGDGSGGGCDPEVCNGSEGDCSGGFCYFCSWVCRDGGCQQTCTE